MRFPAHSIWTTVVQPPSLLQLAKRYILPTGQHLDTLIQEGAAPPLQFLQFVQDSVDEKTWADAQWHNLLPADLWVDTATGKRGQREWLNGDEVQVAMDFIRNQHGVTSESCCPFRIASVFAFDILSGSDAPVDSDAWAALDRDWAAVDDTLSRPGFGLGSRRVLHMSECEDLIFPINVRRKDTSGVHFVTVRMNTPSRHVLLFETLKPKVWQRQKFWESAHDTIKHALIKWAKHKEALEYAQTESTSETSAEQFRDIYLERKRNLAPWTFEIVNSIQMAPTHSGRRPDGRAAQVCERCDHTDGYVGSGGSDVV